MSIHCKTCGVSLMGQEAFVKFPCPKCGEEEIIRCKKCKTLSAPYKCKKCGFIGP